LYLAAPALLEDRFYGMHLDAWAVHKNGGGYLCLFWSNSGCSPSRAISNEDSEPEARKLQAPEHSRQQQKVASSSRIIRPNQQLQTKVISRNSQLILPHHEELVLRLHSSAFS